MELRRFRADCHIHSCLSPCGELTMPPRAIVELALAAELEIIAVTDHNATENCSAAQQAARGSGLIVLGGVEATSEEEVHVLGLFEPDADLSGFQSVIYDNLPDLPSKRKFVRDQVIVDAEDGVTGFNGRCLFAATRLPVQDLVGLIHDHGGLAVASHVDRPSFSVISQLGFVPPGLGLDAAEVSPLVPAAEARAKFGLETGLPIVRFSDAHRPEEVGTAVTDFFLAAPRLAEIRLALAGAGGRRVELP